MNAVFKELSLLAGGSHYPTINPDMQQRFGELIVKKVIERIEHEITLAYEQDQTWTATVLQCLSLELLNDFDMELELDEEMDEE